MIFVAIPTRTSPLAFGSVFDKAGRVEVTGGAVAGTESVTVGPCALCVLKDLDVTGGRVQVNGGGSLYATDGSATATVAAPSGIYLTHPGTGSGFSPAPVITDQPVVDPFAGAGAPTPPTSKEQDVDCGAPGKDVLDPGTYRDLAVVGTCSLNPGVYELTRDLVIDSGAVLQGNSVTLVFRNNDTLELRGGVVSLGAPAPGHAFSLYFSGPDDKNPIAISSGFLGAGGAVYGELRTLDMSAGAATIRGTVVLGHLKVAGGPFNINSGGSGVPQAGQNEIALVK